jgi:predicted transcriptional regulator of viral defense system
VSSRDAYSALRKLGATVVSTSDAAALLQQSTSAAAKTLSRLAGAGLIQPVRHGMFWMDGPVDPYRLPQYLTAPLESYVSLQSALHVHGLIDQIPSVYYVVSLARTQRITTRAGTFSVHHVDPVLFGGYVERESGVKLATPEKALFDFAYLSTTRTRLFTALPELELPKPFRRAELRRWLAKISSERLRTITQRKLTELGAL